jgi:hypothetical protein
MKIIKVIPNNRKRAFEVHTRSKQYLFPYAVVKPTPSRLNRVKEVHLDSEMANEGFVYQLASGEEGAVHIDHVLEYSRDPAYLTDQLLYNLTLCAQTAVKKSELSVREIIRRLGTSPAQFYRLLDQTNYRKSMRQLLALLHILHYDVDVVLKAQKVIALDAPQPEVRISSLSSQVLS